MLYTYYVRTNLTSTSAEKTAEKSWDACVCGNRPPVVKKKEKAYIPYYVGGRERVWEGSKQNFADHGPKKRDKVTQMLPPPDQKWI